MNPIHASALADRPERRRSAAAAAKRLPLVLAAALLLTAGGGCLRSPPREATPADAELARESAAGRLALARGASDDAAILFRRALNRARVMDDPAEIGRTAYQLAEALLRTGQYEAARTALEESESATLRAGGNTADVLTLEAKVAQLLDDPAAALVLADRALTEKGAKPTDLHRFKVYLLRGEVAMDLKRRDLAQAALARAKKLAGVRGVRDSAPLQAGLAGLEARVIEAMGDPGKAGKQYDQQAERLREARQYRDMAPALVSAGSAYAAAGDRLYRAARSFDAQGDAQAAARLLNEAEAAARTANDADLVDRIRDLRPTSTQPAALDEGGR